MIDASTKQARLLATSAVCIAAACTTAMNVKFGWSIGSDEFEKYVYVVFGVALDACKVLGLGFVSHAFLKGYRIKAISALLIWVVAVGYSVTAAIGFAAMSRSAIMAENNHKVNQALTAKDEYQRLLANIATMKTNKRYNGTNGCTAIVESESRAFCHGLEEEQAKLMEAKSKLPTDVIKLETDPQMAFFAKFLGIDQTRIFTFWVVALAIVAEAISSIGTYAFSSSRRKPVYKKNRYRQTPFSFGSSDNRLIAAKGKRRTGRPPGSKNRPKI